MHKLKGLSFDEILSSTAIFYAIPIFTVICYAWILVKNSRKQGYPLPPGPRGLPLVGSLLFLDPELHSHFANLAATYGPIFSLRLGGKITVVITSPAVAREVLKQNDIVFANRDPPHVVTAMEYGGHDIVFSPHGPEWRMLRKAYLRDMLGQATLEGLYCHRRHEVRRIVRNLYGLKGAKVDIGQLMFSGVLNMMTSTLWGGTIEGAEGGATGAEFRQVVEKITELLEKPNVSDFFPGLAWLDLQGLKKEMKEVVGKLELVLAKIIEEGMEEEGRRANGSNIGKGSCFLQVLLQLRERGDTEIPLTMIHIKALLVDMVAGGTDTIASTVEFAIAEMMNKPEVMERVQREVDAVVDENRAVEESDINKLSYLNAVIKEVLRLHPVVPLLVPHCPSKPCVVAGYTVPKGAPTFVNVWAIHRDPQNWTDPNEFIPERFLNSEGNSSNDFTYLPFGSGRRSCVGGAMAKRIVVYSLASLVHSFRWEVADGESLDLSEKFGIILKKKVPLLLFLCHDYLIMRFMSSYRA